MKLMIILLPATLLSSVTVHVMACDRNHGASNHADLRRPEAWNRRDRDGAGLKPGKRCHIPGRTFAGGGEGICDVHGWITVSPDVFVRSPQGLPDRPRPGRTPGAPGRRP